MVNTPARPSPSTAFRATRSGLAWTLMLGVGLWGQSTPAKADLQARYNVAANALAADGHAAGHRLAVAGFTAADGAAPAGLAEALEHGLFQALQKKGGFRLVEMGQVPRKDDWLMTGTYSVDSSLVRLHAVLQAPDGSQAWSRDLQLEATDFGIEAAPSTAPPAPEAYAGGHGESIPSLPRTGVPQQVPVIPGEPRYGIRPRGYREPWHARLDLSLGYKAFYPVNSTFQSAAGLRQDASSIGLDFNDVLLMDWDDWSATVNGPGGLQGVDYHGFDVALVAPVRVGPLTLYLGPGGRFADLEVRDPSVFDATGFGNNGLTAVAGAKLRFDPLGLDLRYTYDLVSSYTGYHTLRLGFLYAFGR